jgi:hypothetical protein
LALDGKWQKLDKIRILMGDEVTARTRQAILEWPLQKRFAKSSTPASKPKRRKMIFSPASPPSCQAMRDGKIECRAFAKRKFHAKAYITHPRVAVIGSVALVGSSNFTVPGLTQNIELNIQIRAPGDVRHSCKTWFEKHWARSGEHHARGPQGTVERQIPRIHAVRCLCQSLDELFRTRHELTASEWETTESKIYPVLGPIPAGWLRIPSLKSPPITTAHFFATASVLGKTFIGLMLIERLVMYEKKRVVLFVPKSGRGRFGSATSSRYLPHLSERLPLVQNLQSHRPHARRPRPTARISRRSLNR